MDAPGTWQPRRRRWRRSQARPRSASPAVASARTCPPRSNVNIAQECTENPQEWPVRSTNLRRTRFPHGLLGHEPRHLPPRQREPAQGKVSPSKICTANRPLLRIVHTILRGIDVWRNAGELPGEFAVHHEFFDRLDASRVQLVQHLQFIVKPLSSWSNR